jgi:transcriptional regulator with XRE-family HTH domain
MATSGFSKRFREVVEGLSDAELGAILGVTTDAARKMRRGRIKSLKLEAALRLARELKVSPWFLGGEVEPTGLSDNKPATRTRAGRRRRVDEVVNRAQLDAAQSALLLHDELIELRACVQRLERAVEKLQSRREASSER